MLWQVFGNGQETLLAIQFNDFRRIDCVDQLAGTLSKARGAVPDDTMFADFINGALAFPRIVPDANLENCAANQVLAQIAVAAFEGFIYLYEAPFVQRRDGKGDRA